MLNQLSRPHLPILCMALGLAACAAPGGVDGDLSGVGGKSDEVGAETLKVEVAAFQNALAWHAETGGSSDDARWAALRGRAETLRGFATTGELADADALLLREELLPLTGRLERAHAITDEYELMCAAGPLDVRGALVREGASDQSLTLPADLDTVGSEVRGDVMDATCDPTVLNRELVAAGVKQSLANDMRLRLTLLPAEYDWLATDPVDYVERRLATLPSGLAEFAADAREPLLAEAYALTEALDPFTIERIRTDTLISLASLEDTINTEVAAEVSRDEEFPARYREWCAARLDELATSNVLLFTETVRDHICRSRFQSGRNAGPVRHLVITASELGEIVADLSTGVAAYLEVLEEARDTSDPREELEALVLRNVTGVSAALHAYPSCIATICDATAAAIESAATWAMWDDVILWGTVAVAIIAVATGVGAIAVGFAGASFAGAVGAAATVAAAVSTGLSLVGGIYLSTRAAHDLIEANRDLAALVVSGADPGQVRQEHAAAAALLEQALLTGVMSLAEVGMAVRFVISAGRAGRPSALLSQAVAEARGARVATSGYLDDVDDVIRARQVDWESTVLRQGRPQTEAEVRQIVRQANDESSALFAELQRHLASSRGVDDAELWNLYFRSYDRMLLHNRDYQALMAHADRALPQSGLIVDAGAGTGNFSSYLARSQDGRRMLSFEQADDGLAQTAEKLRAILGDRAGRHVQTRGSLLEVDSISGGVGADGYVLNNVLYTLGDDGERVFTSLARDLKPGGIMYLNDPMSFVTREGFIEQFITDLAVDAWKRGAPMTGHDIALIAAVNSGRLVRSSGGATPIFRTPAQLRELAARAGLEVVEEGTAYLSSTYTLILRRP